MARKPNEERRRARLEKQKAYQREYRKRKKSERSPDRDDIARAMLHFATRNLLKPGREKLLVRIIEIIAFQLVRQGFARAQVKRAISELVDRYEDGWTFQRKVHLVSTLFGRGCLTLAPAPKRWVGSPSGIGLSGGVPPITPSNSVWREAIHGRREAAVRASRLASEATGKLCPTVLGGMRGSLPEPDPKVRCLARACGACLGNVGSALSGSSGRSTAPVRTRS